MRHRVTVMSGHGKAGKVTFWTQKGLDAGKMVTKSRFSLHTYQYSTRSPPLLLKASSNPTMEYSRQ